MKNSRIRLGIVGCGRVAEQCHIPAALRASGLELAALVDSDSTRLDYITRSFGLTCTAATAYQSLPGLVDAALLLLPNHLHFGVARDLLEAGIHVLCEKPMASTSREARSLCSLADGRGLVLAVGYMKRYEPNFALMQRLIEQDWLGRLRRFEFEFGSAGGWAPISGYNLDRQQAGGGVLLVNGCHLLDRMLCWFGSPSKIAYADDAHGGVEANCSAVFAFDSGLAGEMRLSKTVVLRNRFRLHGDRGRIEISDSQRESVTFFPAGTHGIVEEIFDHPRPDPLTDVQYFQLQLEDFARAIRTGTSPRVPGSAAAASIELVEHCYQVRTALPERWSSEPLPALAGASRGSAVSAGPCGVEVEVCAGAFAGPAAAVIQRTAAARQTGVLSDNATTRTRGSGGHSRVLVTGATGFVGSRLCEVLHLGGAHEPRAFVHSSGKASYIARYPLEFALGDLTDPGTVRRAMEGCTSVVHLARGTDEVMIGGLKNVLRAAIEARVRRFVHVSSVAVHGDNPAPAAESEAAPVHRTGNPYGDLKLEQEKLVRWYGRRFGLPFVILRPPHIMGPYSHFIAAARERLQSRALPIVDGGTNPCNLVYIDNLVEAILLSLDVAAAAGETFFVTDRERVSWRRCLEDLGEIFGVEVPHATDDQLVGPEPVSAAARLLRLSRLLAAPEFRAAVLEAPGLGGAARVLYRGYALLPVERRNYVRGRLEGPASTETHRAASVRYDPDDYLIASQRRKVAHSCEKAERILGYTAPVGYGQALSLTREWLEFARAV